MELFAALTICFAVVFVQAQDNITPMVNTDPNAEFPTVPGVPWLTREKAACVITTVGSNVPLRTCAAVSLARVQ